MTVDNLILIGPMGAGKSTVGRQLASRLSFEFVDTDQLIERRAGADIPWIFDVEGEDGFRARETAVLLGMTQLTRHVIATGGGIIEREVNLPVLQQLGTVIYLTASLEQLYARTCKDKKRPLLQVDDPKGRIASLFARRDPIYRKIADWVLETDGRGSQWVVNRIVSLLNQARGRV